MITARSTPVSRGVGGRRRGVRRRPDPAGDPPRTAAWGTCSRSPATGGWPPRPARSGSTSSPQSCPPRPGSGCPPAPAPTDPACTPGPGSRSFPTTTPTPGRSPAHPPQRPHRGAGLPARYSPHPVPLRQPGPRRRATLADRGVLPNRQGPHRARPAPGPPLDLLAPLGHPGHARARVPDRHHRRRTRPHPMPDGLIRSPSTSNAACSTPCCSPHSPSPACCTGPPGDDDTKPEPAQPLPPTGITMITNYGCSTRARYAATRFGLTRLRDRRMSLDRTEFVLPTRCVATKEGHHGGSSQVRA